MLSRLPEPGQRILTPAEVARLFGVHPRTVTKWANEGKIPHFKTPSGQRRFREPQVRALLNGQAGQ